jgi:carbamate kinase
MSSNHSKFIQPVVVAIGGNAITREFEEGNIYQQFANTRQSLVGVVEMISEGHCLVLTHGNGPQIGNSLIRVEASRHLVPPIPLGVLVADTEGGMGYMIEQSLQNMLLRRGIPGKAATILTQVVVDQNDPSILNPTKFVGPFYTKEEAKKIEKARGWILKKDAGRGWRRVVPSPRPIEIVEKEFIQELIEKGVVVIACGGGGIPVYVEEDGTYEGVDGVIDKDLAAAVLARDIRASQLIILTSVDKVALHFGSDHQIDLDQLTTSEAKTYLSEGEFPPGSMGPKIEAAVQFLEEGGKEVLITSVERMTDGRHGATGTRIIPN